MILNSDKPRIVHYVRAATGSVIKLPLQFLQLFTGSKSFRDNPILGSWLLNRMGLHVARVIVAAVVTRFRFLCLQGFAASEHRATYLRDGYLKIENFLPLEEFESLKNELQAVDGEVRQCVQGDTLTQRILLDDNSLSTLPGCTSLLADRAFSRLLRYTASRNTSPIYYLQCIRSNAVDGEQDPQRNLHSDTFHSTMKAWLFLDDVSDRNGPFTYVPGSQRLTLKRLKWEYHQSLSGSRLKDSYGARGSLRIDEKDLPGLGLQQPVAFKVPANTLIIGDTHGFHRRGAATEVSSRMELWAFSRTNPFNPWPGLNIDLYRRLSHYAIKKYLLQQDKKANRKGMRASWHRVANDTMHRDTMHRVENPQQPEVLPVSSGAGKADSAEVA